MKRILSIVFRDIKSGTRDWLILYLSIAPILFAVILKMFIPSAGDTSINFVILEESNHLLENHLSAYSNVETVKDLEKLEERVLRIDDVFGVVMNSGGPELIVQGNEVEGTSEIAKVILLNYNRNQTQLPVDLEFSDIGWEISPLKLEGANLLIIFNTVLGGMLILLNLVEEKMSNTIGAINVSPTKRWEFVVGKGLLGFLLSFIGAIAVVLILGFEGIHFGMLLVSVLAIAFIGAIVGFGIGINNHEPISAIASMKMIFIPVLISIFGAMYLPEKWLPLLYWSPFYWAYDIIRDILLMDAQWSKVLMNSGIILGITVIVFLGLRKKIIHGLS